MFSKKHSYQVVLLILLASSFVPRIHPAVSEGNENSTNPTSSTTKHSKTTTSPNFTSNDDKFEHFRTATSIISVVGVISNALLLMVIIIDPAGNLHKGAWVTMLNLAFADTLASACTIIHSSVSWILSTNEPAYFEVIEVNMVALNIAYSASFFMLTLLTVEVFIATKYPLHCKFILTRTKVRMICACSWLLAFCLNMPNVILGDDHTKLINQLFVGWIAVLEFAVVVQVIFKILIISEIVKSRRNITNSYRSGKQRNIAKTVIILNFVLIITAVPYFISLQLMYLARLEIIEKTQFVNDFSVLYHPVASINYVINPFLYAWRLPDYRRTLLACCSKRNPARELQLQSLSNRSSAKDTVVHDTS